MANEPWGQRSQTGQAPPQQPEPGYFPPASQPSDVSDIIAKAAVRGKFLDFRNGLVPATVYDYAMVHGIGGKDHAPRSGIRCLITDYTDKRNHVIASANLAPELFPYIMSVCERNAGMSRAAVPEPANSPANQLVASLSGFVQQILPPGTVPGSTDAFVAIPVPMMRELKAVGEQGDTAAKAIIDSVRGTQPLPPDRSGVDYIAVRQNLLQTFLTSATRSVLAAPEQKLGGEDFFYKQDRVNVYKKDARGYCPVSIISINRQGLRKNGEVSRLPWTISIQNFLAPAVGQDGGTTSYNARGILPESKKECSVSVTDFDMYRCCHRVCRFIELWEMTQWPPILQQALLLKRQQRQEQ